MFTQLNPNLPLNVIGKGDGYAIGVIDYGQEHNLIWVTVLNANGEVWAKLDDGQRRKFRHFPRQAGTGKSDRSRRWHLRPMH